LPGYDRATWYKRASANRAANIAQARERIAVPACPKPPETPETAAIDHASAPAQALPALCERRPVQLRAAPAAGLQSI
jgi:hypothetical protein